VPDPAVSAVCQFDRRITDAWLRETVAIPGASPAALRMASNAGEIAGT
jgi:hypothetical protein